MMFIPDSWLHAWILTPSTSLLSMRAWHSVLRLPTPSSRSTRSASSISRYCASTIGCLTSPLPCSRASTHSASSHRSCVASHRGLCGKKATPTSRIHAGTICTAQGMRNAAVDWLGSSGPLEMQCAAAYWMKNCIRMPQVIAHCWKLQLISPSCCPSSPNPTSQPSPESPSVQSQPKPPSHHQQVSILFINTWCPTNLINRHDGARHAYAHACDGPAHAQHRHADGRALHCTAHDPQPAAHLQRRLARPAVRQRRADKRAQQRAGRHGCRDAALHVRDGVVEVPLVGLRADNARHGRDVEAEQAAALEKRQSWG
ncbi:hypothetical protein S40285_10313 [Stachybotrys chlorohalonatus IBT 40285]|uniref:Uncharacterized protein n=1 Tax=Stachybotrys chlorohalonatus (strain IBT 40285) TaxID=1283841 RepID=A0A084QYN3_STAC4|nr:hypothetical protein S40285_10313 [Stachybotrys chlorohalonata IBT 40285]